MHTSCSCCFLRFLEEITPNSYVLVQENKRNALNFIHPCYYVWHDCWYLLPEGASRWITRYYLPWREICFHSLHMFTALEKHTTTWKQYCGHMGYDHIPKRSPWGNMNRKIKQNRKSRVTDQSCVFCYKSCCTCGILEHHLSLLDLQGNEVVLLVEASIVEEKATFFQCGKSRQFKHTKTSLMQISHSTHS